MNPASIARYLRWLYAVLAVLAVFITVWAALRGNYGSAVLNAVIVAVWVTLFLRLRGR
jgi:4-hydroxybenzoate polyprenyltransferase